VKETAIALFILWHGDPVAPPTYYTPEPVEIVLCTDSPEAEKVCGETHGRERDYVATPG